VHIYALGGTHLCSAYGTRIQDGSQGFIEFEHSGQIPVSSAVLIAAADFGCLDEIPKPVGGSIQAGSLCWHEDFQTWRATPESKVA
jgi:hypothetical protein